MSDPKFEHPVCRSPTNHRQARGTKHRSIDPCDHLACHFRFGAMPFPISRHSISNSLFPIPSVFPFPRKCFCIFLQNSQTSSNSLSFPAIPAKFREICGEKCSICWKIRKISQKSGNFKENLQNHAKICTGAVQRCNNLVDLEKCWKMRLLSLSEVSIQKRTSPGKLGIRDFEISFAISQVLAFELRGQVFILVVMPLAFCNTQDSRT